ncbi:MAG: 50S ribosomal protein L7ae [Clostridia bacterium]|nr:50S ribosomal protein L7ae [Clostridia bacterium]
MINNRVLGLIGLCTKAGKICFGTDACTDLIIKKKIELVIVANDASDRTKRNFEFICNKNNTKICFFGTIENLSKAIGKNNKAVIGIKSKDFANQIEKIINGGEIIG